MIGSARSPRPHEKGGAALTLAGPDVIAAGFAFPGLRAIGAVGSPAQLHFHSNWPEVPGIRATMPPWRSAPSTLPLPGYDSGMVEARAHTSARQQPRAGSREASNPLLFCGLGLLLPGVGHMALGRRGTGAVFLVSIGLLFVLGIRMEGELFPFEAAAPLTLLAGIAQMGAGGFYLAARLLGLGAGIPEAPSYEYGYAFLIVAGLMNMLVALDAWDIATGAKGPAEDAAPQDGPRSS